jgi:hypothetical protein
MENIKLNLRKTGCGLDSSGSEQELIAGTCEYGNGKSHLKFKNKEKLI